MRLDWCVESCDRIIGEIDICIFMDYRFGGRSDMLDIQISDTFMNNKSVAKIQQIMFRCTIVRSFQRANPAMLKKIIYVVSVIHRV